MKIFFVHYNLAWMDRAVIPFTLQLRNINNNPKFTLRL